MTTIQFSFGGESGTTIHVSIQEINAAKAVQQMTEFTEAWLESQANACEECEAVLNLPNADFSGEKN